MPLLPPLPALVGGRRGGNAPLVGFEALGLHQQRAPDQAVVELELEPALLPIRQAVPAADQRLVADVDRRAVRNRLLGIGGEERYVIAAQRIDDLAQFAALGA